MSTTTDDCKSFSFKIQFKNTSISFLEALKGVQKDTYKKLPSNDKKSNKYLKITKVTKRFDVMQTK